MVEKYKLKFKKVILVINIILRRIIFVFRIFPMKGYNKAIIAYLFTGNCYPTMPNQYSWKNIKISLEGDFYKVEVKSEIYYIPQEYGRVKRVKKLYANVLNEQSDFSPHKYLKNYSLPKESIIYDIGASEGFEVKNWLKQGHRVYMFEPIPLNIRTLKRTYEKELANSKVWLFGFGLSDVTKEIEYNNIAFKVYSIDDVIKTKNLPIPFYIKVDVEGEEMRFLEGAKETLNMVHIIEIAVYHKPNDYIDIPEFLSKYNGEGRFIEGVPLLLNRNSEGIQDPNPFNIYKPVIRKCLYRFIFNPSCEENYENS